jgi:soluble lytic murein transglycosylase-like protein
MPEFPYHTALILALAVACQTTGATDALRDAAGMDLAANRLTARALEHGEGVPKDPLRAAELYCQGARAGDAESQFSLGWMHANARGVTRDDAIAAYFFRLAAEQGHEHAKRMLRFTGDAMVAQPACMAPPSVPVDARSETREEPPILVTTPAQQKVAALLAKLAPEYGVSPRLAFAVIRAESNFDPAAISPKNAQGLMQLIPETSARFNVTKPFDPEQNIRGGLSYLRWLLAYFKGSVPLVAAAYNSGEGTVNRFGGIPPYPETKGYVKRVIEGFKHREHPYDPKITEPSPELSRIRLGGPM